MTPATLDPALSASKDERRVTRVRPELVTVLSTFALSALLIVASRFVSPALGSWGQAATVVLLVLVPDRGGVRQGLVILVGGLDLSVASLITLSAVLCTTWVGTEAWRGRHPADPGDPRRLRADRGRERPRHHGARHPALHHDDGDRHHVAAGALGYTTGRPAAARRRRCSP